MFWCSTWHCTTGTGRGDGSFEAVASYLAKHRTQRGAAAANPSSLNRNGPQILLVDPQRDASVIFKCEPLECWSSSKVNATWSFKGDDHWQTTNARRFKIVDTRASSKLVAVLIWPTEADLGIHRLTIAGTSRYYEWELLSAATGKYYVVYLFPLFGLWLRET